MSFILDALKKVERQKGAAGAIRVAEGVFGKTSWAGHRPRGLLTMVSIAAISAGVTAGALSLLGDKPAEPAPEAIAIEPAVAAPEPPQPTLERLPLAEPPVGRALPQVPRAEVTEQAVEGEEISNDTGNEAFAGGGGGAPGEKRPPEAALPDVESLSGPPALVLQGTSVLRGEPVAVINDQRVYEGDRVQGALVIRIEERAVELEFDGRRFTIRL